MEITPEIFDELRSDPVAIEIFRDLDVSDEDQFNMFEMLDIDGSGTLELNELFEGIFRLRGEARRSDIIAVDLMMHKIMEEIRSLQIAYGIQPSHHPRTSVGRPRIHREVTLV